MKQIFTSFLFLLAFQLSAQTYVNVEPQEGSLASILQIFLMRQFEYDVQNYKVTYNTTDVFGDSTVASGLLCIPTNRANTYPLGVYSHGTVDNREAVPSRTGVLERLLPQGMAATGIITVAPDYLGLGDNQGIHPYVHADSEASAGRDLLLAARQWMDEQNISYNDQLFLTGYSQGGHATQALHRDIQTNPGEDGFVVTAATHNSGPYSISDVMRETLFAEGQATLPGYIVYTYIAYDYVYDLFDDFSEIFEDKYIPNIDSFATGQIQLGRFNARLEQQLREDTASLSDLIREPILTQLRTDDPTSPTVIALQDNDTYDWAPEAPTVIYYCTADEQVPFRNAILADSVMRANGSTSVRLESGGPITHRSCATPAFTRSLNFFLQYIDVQLVSLGELTERTNISISPNPVRAGEVVNIQGLSNQALDYIIYDINGRVTGRGITAGNSRVDLPNNISAGVQILRVATGDGRSVVRRFVVK
ncbi:T9SS type A sorting domain-containing protein [Neolewinella antarctica]|uniref:Uncharacterized protein n=1 Tax=Neolewinella antarctica TaxID=442734 RepID=A0ABX0XFY5_9BACT|nr:T9SS type A sorting domain-containing protein [Neolewinella antarctica]NJC28117.1 hypothetical protein [Neolewinella antarctica]